MAQEQDARTARTGRVGAVLLAVAVLCGALSAQRWWHDRDLRPLEQLQRARAVVVDVHRPAKGPHRLTVRFAVPGRTVQAVVPARLRVRAGDPVDVAHVPGQPERVRTVHGWAPGHVLWLVPALALGAVGAPAAAVGLLGRRRR